MKRGLVFLVLLFFSLSFPAAQETGAEIAIEENTAEESANDIAAGAEPAEDQAEADTVQAVQKDAEAEPEPVDTKTSATIGKKTSTAISSYTNKLGFPIRLGIALAIIAIQALLIWLVWAKFFKLLYAKAEAFCGEKIKPLTIKKIRILSTRQIVEVILVAIKILKYVLTALQLYLTVPIVFSLFPATRGLATTLFGYILNPLKDIIIDAIKYIPNLFKIAIIIIITRYAIKLMKFFEVQISKGKLVLPGFYADWAEPTFKIFHVLLWAFVVAIIYPYLPGADSEAFKGVSVFIGIIFSLGSSTAIGNMIAGLVITYMRPFRIGDRVQIKETTGFVVEKNLMVVRIRTHKNEFVTFPNLLILGSSIINYNTSSNENSDGLIIHTEVTFGYATPWETVHEILINAALATDYIQKKPKPYVLQTGLDDFYARYQINCYTKEIEKVPIIYTQLHENIQNGFREAGIDMTSAHYEIFTQIDKTPR